MNNLINLKTTLSSFPLPRNMDLGCVDWKKKSVAATLVFFVFFSFLIV